MSRNLKYNFQVSVNQFGFSVDPDWEDADEILCIDFFEKCCLELKSSNQSNYSMIELGSNQAYYSLLFKHILGVNRTLNIMIEPWIGHMERSKSQFALNNCEGIYYNNSVGGKTWGFMVDPQLASFNHEDYKGEIHLDQVLNDNGLQKIDLLHCDIDGSEENFIKSHYDFFKNHKVHYVFMLTHGGTSHDFCKNSFSDFNYELLYESPPCSVGSDTLLVYKRKEPALLT